MFVFVASAASQSVLKSEEVVGVPQAPELEFLYTAFVECLPSVYESQGPRGIRKAIPIVGYVCCRED